ncbi:hypothetical protein RUM43_000542 [Polyplax serrata]|uniref:Uncharacterized protein n=1 Tax=Polyplax serrata TaxID=468196 RepID=A0AAN8XP66_POLSC
MKFQFETGERTELCWIFSEKSKLCLKIWKSEGIHGGSSAGGASAPDSSEPSDRDASGPGHPEAGQAELVGAGTRQCGNP